MHSHPSSVILQRTVLVAVTIWEDRCVEEQCWYWFVGGPNLAAQEKRAAREVCSSQCLEGEAEARNPLDA